MPITEDQKWHWGEGTKYAIEGGKALFLTNSAAAIAILTFIGNTKTKEPSIAIALINFAGGTLASALIFVFCYSAQRYYGNDDKKWAIRWHTSTYVVVLLSVAFFASGMVVAGRGFLALH